MKLKEKMEKGVRSILEFFILEGVFTYSTSNCLFLDLSKNMLLLYNAVVDICNSLSKRYSMLKFLSNNALIRLQLQE